MLFLGWNELLIAGISYRSVVLNDGIVLATGLVIDRRSAHSVGFENIYERILGELVAKFREMRLDLVELGCLRAIVLMNPGRYAGIRHFPGLFFGYNIRDRLSPKGMGGCRKERFKGNGTSWEGVKREALNEDGGVFGAVLASDFFLLW